MATETKKEELLGTVVIETSGTAVPNLENLKKEFEDEKTVISAFCQNCNSYHELNFDVAEKIFMTLKQSLEFEGKYLIFHSCQLCKGEDKTVELKNF